MNMTLRLISHSSGRSHHKTPSATLKEPTDWCLLVSRRITTMTACLLQPWRERTGHRVLFRHAASWTTGICTWAAARVLPPRNLHRSSLRFTRRSRSHGAPHILRRPMPPQCFFLPRQNCLWLYQTHHFITISPSS